MFRTPGNVVVPQAEHGRMAGAIAAVWGLPQPLPFESLVRGVTLHDRGYGERDIDQIGVVGPERWVEIQRRGFSERSGDAIVDLVVALHVRRLIGDDDHPARIALAHEIEAALPDLRAAAAVDEEQARVADGVTEVCDRLSFVFCSGEAVDGEVRGIRYRYDGAETIVLDPWPLAVPWLRGVVGGFTAHGYPIRLIPVVELFRLEPGA